MSWFTWMVGIVGGALLVRFLGPKLFRQFILRTNLVRDILRKNIYWISYTHRGDKFKIPIVVRKGPRKLMTAETSIGLNVTEQIRQILGPSEDCHGQLITPKDLGMEDLSIWFYNGQMKEFGALDFIQIN